jgi:hypothetical protein
MEGVEMSVVARMVTPDGPEVAVYTIWMYDPGDPFAVTVRFQQADEHVDWTFARDLLADGLADGLADKAVGLGDVRIFDLSFGFVGIILESPDGAALFSWKRGPLARFLQLTYQKVPRMREGEHQDLDKVLDRILDRDGGMSGI